MDALEFLARLVTHIPDPGQVRTRYYGWCAKRTRGIRRRALGADAAPPVEVAAPVPLPLREARRRWAALLRRIFEVDPLVCPRCGEAMRIVAFLTEPAVLDRILTRAWPTAALVAILPARRLNFLFCDKSRRDREGPGADRRNPGATDRTRRATRRIPALPRSLRRSREIPSNAVGPQVR